MFHYILPNVSQFNPQGRGRGSLSNRVDEAKRRGCEIVEIPFDLAKNLFEFEALGLSEGEFLTKAELEKTFEIEPVDFPYSMHTEPQNSHKRKIRWCDESWVSRYSSMIGDFVDLVGSAPSIVEIHPGKKPNTLEHICRSIVAIKESPGLAREKTIFLLENRTGQIINNTGEILAFREAARSICGSIPVGIILDSFQFFGNRENALQEARELLPEEFILGYHIHNHHKPLMKMDANHEMLFEFISGQEGDRYINPEVLSKSQIDPALRFLREHLG